MFKFLLLTFLASVKANTWEKRSYTVEKTPADYKMASCKTFEENCLNKTTVPYNR